MPRSGTTLTELICASHHDIYGAGELATIRSLAGELGFDQPDPAIFAKAMVSLTPTKAKELGSKYLGRLNKRNGKAARVIDKMPHNFELLAFIGLILPNARIVHCRRHPMDNCTSCFMHNFSDALGYNADLTKLGQYYRHMIADATLGQGRSAGHPRHALRRNRGRSRNPRSWIDRISRRGMVRCLSAFPRNRAHGTNAKPLAGAPADLFVLCRALKLYGDALDPLKAALGPLVQL